MTTALLTDRYELSMLESAVVSGMADRPAVFEMFARRLPAGRRFGLLAGTGRFLDALNDFTFDEATLDWLQESGVIRKAAREYLTDWRFAGDISGYHEGDLYWPGSPVLTVRGRLADCFLLETLALSIFNHDTAVASAAARMVLAANYRRLFEMGSRRVDPEAAIAGARAAYIAGFAATSNLEAGRRYGIPTMGTAAHAWTLAHDNELNAFLNQIRSHGVGTTLLVDTYDIEKGIERALSAANLFGYVGPGAIRIDSGDLAEEAWKARAQLDAARAFDTDIVVSSDLDEYAITELATAPISSYGAGTRVATGSGHPSAGFVYKLVAIAESNDRRAPMRPVEKKATGKGSAGGEKHAYRLDSVAGPQFWRLDQNFPADAMPLQRAYIMQGQPHRAGWPSLAAVRTVADRSLRALPAEARLVTDGQPLHICTKEEDRP